MASLAGVLSCGHAALAQSGVTRKTPSGTVPNPHPDTAAFRPPEAVFHTELSLDFENDGVIDFVLAYAVPENEYSFMTGVRVLKYNAASGWAVAFEETNSVTNGGGADDTIAIEKVTSSGGKDGTVVILKTSGAGTAMDWHLLASGGNKIFRLDPTRIRRRVLAAQGYRDWGYNRVITKDDLTIETQPGYSEETARCCPDRPSIEISIKFTGSSIKLNSVKTLPFSPANRE